MEAHFWRPLVYVTSFSPRGDFPGTFLFLCYFLFCFLAVPFNMWDFTSWPRDQTHIPCIGGLQSLGREEPLEEEMATTHSSILAWRIPWTEDPGGL